MHECIVPIVPASRQYAFHEGKLFMKEQDAILMARPWPSPAAWIRLGGKGLWKPYLPRDPLITPVRRHTPRREPSPQLALQLDDERRHSEAEKKRIALARFRARFPKPVSRAVEPFRRLQWQLLLACRWSDRFLQLLQSNPALAYLWIRQQADPTLTPRRCEAAALRPQRELLGELSLSASKSALKILRKVYIPALGWEMAEGLQNILRDDGLLSRVRHLERLGTGVIALGARPELLASSTPKLLTEVAASKDELYAAPSAARLENHLEMCRILDECAPQPFRSRDHLHAVHRDLLQRYQEHLQRTRSTSIAGSQFPPPPIPGTQTIQPLQSEQELVAEGREQDNCVATYARRVRAGTHYIYRLTWPQRCTLSIVRERNGDWVRRELEVSGNRPASASSCQAVDTWLQRHRRLLDTTC